MTHTEAIAIREKQLSGHTVPPLVLAKAVNLISNIPNPFKCADCQVKGMACPIAEDCEDA